MIYESFYYKNDLEKIAVKMRKRLKQKRWSERSYFPFEKDVFWAFYIIRKLIETRAKISNRTAQMEVDLIAYPLGVSKPNHFNRFEYWDLYDLSKPQTIVKKLPFICNQAIHSYVFCPDWDKGGEMGVVLNSFNERDKFLYRIDLSQLIVILETVAKDYPSSGWTQFNVETHDYDFFDD
tara:strand:- start:1588 stop:2124 length:537 start_codon:yes stop_codon:yes gene_type:complete